jgi:hypothetical protein
MNLDDDLAAIRSRLEELQDYRRALSGIKMGPIVAFDLVHLVSRLREARDLSKENVDRHATAIKALLERRR